MKVVVTGVAGFIGSAIARRLITLPNIDSVVGIDCFSDYYSRDLKTANVASVANPKFTFVEGDLNQIDLASLVDGAEVIFHQAGQPGVRASWGREFQTYVDANILATQRLLESIVDLEGVRLVYASSSSVYGEQDSYPVTELSLPRPRSPYGVTKLGAEQLCSLYAANFGVQTVSLRYFTVYGPGQRPDMAFTRFITAALNDSAITVYGSGRQVREFTYVDDIVEANLAAGFRDVAPGTVVNICGGSTVTLAETIDMIGESCKRTINIDYVKAVDGDVLVTSGVNEAARRLLGWKPETSVLAGISAQVEWIRGLQSSVGPSVGLGAPE